MATVDPFRFTYQRNEKGKWKKLTTLEEYERMEKSIKNAYVDHDMILASMHDGLTVRTPFAAYRAIPIDDRSTE